MIRTLSVLYVVFDEYMGHLDRFKICEEPG